MTETDNQNKRYIAIDLKSFYASVECVERGLDPLDANLVVADASRTDKTICLAVSPSLKAYGIPGRARLFEAKTRIKEVNDERRKRAPGRDFTGKSYFASRLAKDPSLALDYIIAPPRMAFYMEYSRNIVEIYLRYVSANDLLVYSIDEVFIDATPYLGVLGMSAHDFAMMLVKNVLSETGITATAGIGTNMFLAKVAMDVVAKHVPADSDGVRIAELDEMSFREKLWSHEPLTDFWRIGHGIAARLEAYGMHTLGDVARCSVSSDRYFNEDLLYKLFGVNAELIIDHAWGYEPATIASCKQYMPESKSISSGQVLSKPYTAEKGRLVVREMADQLSLELVKKELFTDQITLDISYDTENLTGNGRKYGGAVETDRYGRKVPKGAHGSCNLEYTSATSSILSAISALYDKIVDKDLLVRRFNISFAHLVTKEELDEMPKSEEQLTFFDDPEKKEKEEKEKKEALEKENRMQKAVLAIRKRYGKNSIVKGMNMEEGATAIERNSQIGGHKA